jgi:hypothetical protein
MLALKPEIQLELFDVGTLGVTNTSHLALIDRTNELLQKVSDLFVDEIQLKFDFDFDSVFTFTKSKSNGWIRFYNSELFSTRPYTGNGGRTNIIHDTARQVNGVEINAEGWLPAADLPWIDPDTVDRWIYPNPCREIDLTTIRPTEPQIAGIGDYIVRNDFTTLRDVYVVPPRNVERINLETIITPPDWERYVFNYEAANPITTQAYNVDGEEE